MTKMQTLPSQSVAIGSVTAWFPFVTNSGPCTNSAAFETFQTYTQNIVHVVQNLTVPQSQLFFSQSSPTVFCPHVGLFVSEFAVGTTFAKGK